MLCLYVEMLDVRMNLNSTAAAAAAGAAAVDEEEEEDRVRSNILLDIMQVRGAQGSLFFFFFWQRQMNVA